MHAKGNVTANSNWPVWFAAFSPILGILLGALGVFIFAL